MTPTPDDAMPDEIIIFRNSNGGLEFGPAPDGCDWLINTHYIRADKPHADDMQRQDIVPGMMYCAKCKFCLTRRTLYVQSGNVGSGTNETEPCPNGCGPLWPMTWKMLCDDYEERLVEEIEKNKALSQSQPVIPDGYAMVPVEPTEEMLDAAIKDLDQYKIRNVAVRLSVGRAYLLMISAASKEQEKGNE